MLNFLFLHVFLLVRLVDDLYVAFTSLILFTYFSVSEMDCCD